MEIKSKYPLAAFIATMFLGAMISMGTPYLMAKEGIPPNQSEMLDMQINRDLATSIEAIRGYGPRGRQILLRYTYPLDMALPVFLGGTMILTMLLLIRKNNQKGLIYGLLALPVISALSDLAENSCSIAILKNFETQDIEPLLLRGRFFTHFKFAFMLLSLLGIGYLFLAGILSTRRLKAT